MSLVDEKLYCLIDFGHTKQSYKLCNVTNAGFFHMWFMSCSCDSGDSEMEPLKDSSTQETYT